MTKNQLYHIPIANGGGVSYNGAREEGDGGQTLQRRILSQKLGLSTDDSIRPVSAYKEEAFRKFGFESVSFSTRRVTEEVNQAEIEEHIIESLDSFCKALDIPKESLSLGGILSTLHFEIIDFDNFNNDDLKTLNSDERSKSAERVAKAKDVLCSFLGIRLRRGRVGNRYRWGRVCVF